jgi:hypothetical protein
MRASTRHPRLAFAKIAFDTLQALAELAHITLELFGPIAHSATAEFRNVSLHCLHLPADSLPHRGDPGLRLAGPLRPAIPLASLVGFRPTFLGDFLGPAKHFVRVSGDLVGVADFAFGSELLGFHLKLPAFLPQLIGIRLRRRQGAGRCDQRDQQDDALPQTTHGLGPPLACL